MTWLADNENTRASGDKRSALLAEREALVAKLEKLKTRPAGKTEASKRFDLQDMTDIAKKILNIDKKLGRTNV